MSVCLSDGRVDLIFGEYDLIISSSSISYSNERQPEPFDTKCLEISVNLDGPQPNPETAKLDNRTDTLVALSFKTDEDIRRMIRNLEQLIDGKIKKD